MNAHSEAEQIAIANEEQEHETEFAVAAILASNFASLAVNARASTIAMWET
jgi:hypothetical protein